jgi:Icc-related predicted phosphoesterase
MSNTKKIKMKIREMSDEERFDKAYDELLQSIKEIDKKYNFSKKESLKKLVEQYKYKPNSSLYSFENFKLQKENSGVIVFGKPNDDTKEYQKEIDEKIKDIISYCQTKQFKGLKFDIMVSF